MPRRRPLITELRASSYKSLLDVVVPLGPLNVLVGPNGAGKSNLIDVVAFLRDALRIQATEALAARGGFETVRFRGKAPAQLTFGVKGIISQYSSANATDEYTLRLNLLKSGKISRSEELLFKRTEGRGRRITSKGRQILDSESDRGITVMDDALALAALSEVDVGGGSEEPLTLSDIFADFVVYNFDDRAMMTPAVLRRTKRLREDGGNLALALAQLDEKGLLEPLVPDVSRILPGLERVRIVPVGEGAFDVALHEQGLNSPTHLANASYGTRRALALLAALHDPEPPPMICIEEVDAGLHPDALDVVVEWLRDASLRTQLLMATHSPALVNRLSPSELIVCERDKTGASLIPAIPSEQVALIEQAAGGELGLGELWFAGILSRRE